MQTTPRSAGAAQDADGRPPAEDGAHAPAPAPAPAGVLPMDSDEARPARARVPSTPDAGPTPADMQPAASPVGAPAGARRQTAVRVPPRAPVLRHSDVGVAACAAAVASVSGLALAYRAWYDFSSMRALRKAQPVNLLFGEGTRGGAAAAAGASNAQRAGGASPLHAVAAATATDANSASGSGWVAADKLANTWVGRSAGGAHISVRDGDWVAMTGVVVAAPHEKPLYTTNNTASAMLVESKVTWMWHILGVPTRMPTSLTLTQARWGLAKSALAVTSAAHPSEKLTAADALGMPVSVPLAEVRGDSLRRQMRYFPLHFYDLVSCGSTTEPLSWRFRILSALVGFLFLRNRRHESSLPLGITATVVGRANVSSGALYLDADPSLGLYVFRSQIMDKIGFLRMTSTLFGIGSAISLGVAAVASYLLLGQYLPHRFNPRRYFPWLCSAPTPTAAPRRAANNSATPHRQRSAASQPTRPPGTPHEHDVPPSNEANECIACHERRAIAALVPCGHMCLCLTCSERLPRVDRRQLCPMCRTPIERVQRVFV